MGKELVSNRNAKTYKLWAVRTRQQLKSEDTAEEMNLLQKLRGYAAHVNTKNANDIFTQFTMLTPDKEEYESVQDLIQEMKTKFACFNNSNYMKDQVSGKCVSESYK